MTQANIMIVEDEAITGKEIQISLEDMGYKVTSVENTGEQAVKKADQDRPDIILMDIRLKGKMDGIEAAEIIRSLFDIPSIFLTAYADDKSLERAKLVMPFGYILKPFQDKDLKVTIDMGLYAAKINRKRIEAEKALQKSHDNLEDRVAERTAKLVSINRELNHEIRIRGQVEKRLRASGKRFRDLVESSSDWIWEVHSKGIYPYSSPQVRELLGYEPEEIIGKSPFDLILPDEAVKITAVFKDAIEKGESIVALENINLHKDGRHIILETSGVPFFDEVGNVVGYRGIDRDITVRRKMEKTLKKKEKNLKEAQQIANLGSWEWDIVNNKLLWSDQMYRIFGLTPLVTKISSDFFLTFVHPEDKDIVTKSVDTAFNKKIFIPHVYRIIRSTGETRTVKALGKIVTGENSKPVRIIGTLQDITEFRDMEMSLKKRYREMRFLNKLIRKVTISLSFTDVVTSALDGINEIIQPDMAMVFILKDGRLLPTEFTLDNQGLDYDKMPVHKVGECLCGLAAREKKPQYSINIHEDIQCTRQECKEAGYHSFAALPLFGKKDIIGILGLASVTERDFKKQALFLELLADGIAVGMQNALLYQDLTLQEERFRIAAESASDVIFERDLETGHVEWFGDVDRILGAGSEELVKTFKGFPQLIHPDDIDRFVEGLKKHQKTKGLFHTNFRIRKKNGEYIFVENRLRNIFNDEGKPIKRIGVCTDVTQKKIAEKRLEDSKHLLQSVFDGISDPLIMVATDMRILKLNKAARSYYGVEFKDAINSKCYEVLRDSYTPCEDCRLAPVIFGNKASNFERKGCMNPERDEQVTTYPVIESSVGIGTIIRISDITDKKQAQALLARADRLSSLGQLSGGIAHEIRNPLGGIKLFLDILNDEDTYNRTETEIEIFDEINTNINRINGIIKRVLAFAKPGEAQFKNLDMNEVIKESLKLFTSKLHKSNIKLKLSLDEFISYIKGDFIGLQQVITNLILNAIQAMDNGGSLSIKTCKRKSSFHEGRWIIAITIQDTGVGIKQEGQENIFNPFFTTKPTGTGLGLAISHQIMERHGGTLSFKSELGKGSTFSIELPDIKET